MVAAEVSAEDCSWAAEASVVVALALVAAVSALVAVSAVVVVVLAADCSSAVEAWVAALVDYYYLHLSVVDYRLSVLG